MHVRERGGACMHVCVSARAVSAPASSPVTLVLDLINTASPVHTYIHILYMYVYICPAKTQTSRTDATVFFSIRTVWPTLIT